MERIDKFLSRELNMTRSAAKALVKSGAVQVDSAVVKSADLKIDPRTTRVFANGREIAYNQYVYIMMNKPKGVISSTDGREAGAKTVVDILPEDMKRKNLFPAGRLDKDTTGFVLITDDGVFAHRILSPKSHVPKTYIAVLDRPFDLSVKDDFESGVVLGDEKCLPASVECVNGDYTRAKVILKQGMYHQIKRMFKKHSITVLELERTAMGALELDAKLAPGQARYLNEEELLLMESAE